MWEHYDETKRASVTCYGGIGFWTDGITLACRVIAPGTRKLGFNIPLRVGAI